MTTPGEHTDARVRRASCFALACVVIWQATAFSAERIHSLVELPMTLVETNSTLRKVQLLTDRRVYCEGEPIAQCYALLDCDKPADCQLILEIRRDGQVTSSLARRAAERRLGFIVDLNGLAPGDYTVRGHFKSSDGKQWPAAESSFRISKERRALVRWPETGLALTLPEQRARDGAWPTHAVVPLGMDSLTSAERLVLEQDGKPVPAQFEQVGTWDLAGRPKWMHVWFVAQYREGKSAAYRLRKRSPTEGALQTKLRALDDGRSIQVDTGAVRFVVERPFAGISKLWFKSAEEGDYGSPLVDGENPGPRLQDDRLLEWSSDQDSTARVEIESQGPLAVVLRAEGWYQSRQKRVAPFCRFVTRITAFAGQPMLRVQHSTILAGNMNDHRLANVQFRLPLVGATGYAYGVDGKQHAGRFLQKNDSAAVDPGAIFLHQERPDRVRLVNPNTAAGSRSDGWFSVLTENAELGLLVRDIWQKYPKEVELGPKAAALHLWPHHGQRAYSLEEELGPRTFYKLPCFHQGRLLDLRLPSDYFRLLELQRETTELRPEWAATANASGVAMTNEFAIVALPKGRANELPGWQRLWEIDPIAMPDPAWCAATAALGTMAARDNDFGPIEDTVEDSLLGYANLNRIAVYGQFVYGNTHHRWLPSEHRASLHRVWFNNHYHTAGLPWMLFFRSGSQPMLAWARINNSYHASIDQVRYDSLRGYRLGDGSTRPGAPEFKWHVPGAFYHCKSHVPWGGEAYGMPQSDSHSGLVGHWVDPDGLLYAWLIDANRWSKDGYELWLRGLKEVRTLPEGGTKREINTTLSRALVAYDYTHDPTMLPAIYGMAAGLRGAPLATQQPGALWEPLWPARYVERTRDPEYRQFVLNSSRQTRELAGIEALGLSALAYKLSGDKQLLLRHSNWLYDLTRSLHKERDPLYNNFGLGPGPLGDGFLSLQWPYFKTALRHAKIKQLALIPEPGDYLHGVSRFDDTREQCGCDVLVLKQRDEAWQIKLAVHALSGGDLHPVSVRMFDPRGRVQVLTPRLDREKLASVVRASGRDAKEIIWDIPADGQLGIYRILIRGYEIGVMQPLTKWPEACVVMNEELPGVRDPVEYRAKATRGYLVPVGQGPVKLTVSAASEGLPTRIKVTDSRGEIVLHRSLMKSRPEAAATLQLNLPASPPTPWLFDVYTAGSGYYSLRAQGGGSRLLLLSNSIEHANLIARAISRRP